MNILLIIAVLILGLQQSVWADDLFKWVDENGVVHYGDAIPLEAAEKERHVLNQHGVTMRILERAKTEEELQAMAVAEQEVERQRRAVLLQRERDQILLDTYLDQEEIEMLRDRRILAIEARIGLTRHYLNRMRSRWDELEAQAGKYNFPFSPDSDLPPLPERLAKEIVTTENAMAEHMSTLHDLRVQQTKLRNQFQNDIERFRKLKGLDQPDDTQELVQRRPE